MTTRIEFGGPDPDPVTGEGFHDITHLVAPAVYGMCRACGSVEVRLDKADGTRDLSAIGESPEYPTGYGCELCS